jgi:hypothetical protein
VPAEVAIDQAYDGKYNITIPFPPKEQSAPRPRSSAPKGGGRLPLAGILESVAMRDIPFDPDLSLRGLRSCPWERLPLGSVVVEWPVIHNASIPELASYPLVTERLRSALFAKYRFLEGRRVTIADPSLGLDEPAVARAQLEARRFLDGLPAMAKLKRELRAALLGRPDAREGLAACGRYEGGPYALTKSWMRSIAGILRDDEAFGAALGLDAGTGDEGPGGGSLGSVIGRLLAGELRALPAASSSLVDVGIDVSFSMTSSGKAELAWRALAELLPPLARRLGTSFWRLWLVAEGASEIDWSRYDPEDPPAMERLMATHRLKPEETRYEPFFRELLYAGPVPERRLCLLITDGACQDRAAALRSLERLADEGIEYVQLVLHEDGEYRESVQLAEGGRGKDGVVPEEEIREEDQRLRRSDEELEVYCSDRLREVTDLAEAARGGQLVLTWYPLFETVALDVYERYLGRVLMG